MALLKNIAEARAVLKLPANNSQAYLPKTAAAELEYLVPILGDALYSGLQTKYDAASLNTQETKLLTLAQSVIVPFAYVMDLPMHQTSLSDTGLTALAVEGSRTAFRWEYNAMVEELQKRGYAAQEQLIIFLQTNKADFLDWSSSPYNDTAGFGIIRNGYDLRGVISVPLPHRTYLMLKPIFQRLQTEIWLQAVGVEFSTALNGRIVNGTTTTEDKILLGFLRSAFGQKAMAIASLELNLRFDANGFSIVDKTATAETATDGRVNANDKQLGMFQASMEQGFTSSFKLAMDYLNKTASATIFNEFFISPYYTDPTLSVAKIDNGKRTGIFVTNR